MEHTFLFADLAGYTALTEAHGDEAAADAAGRFYDEVTALRRGTAVEEVKRLGDAVLLHTVDAADAVRLAGRIVTELGGRHGELGVRAGLHTGAAVSRDGDWFGSGVNIGARVADLARADEVLVTRATRDAARDACLRFERRGAQLLRNVASPVELLALVLDGQPGIRGRTLDPVCGMVIYPHQAFASILHAGRQYFLCTERCAAAFRADPEIYAGRARAQ